MDKNKRDTSVNLKSVYSPGPSQGVEVGKFASKNDAPKYGFGSEPRDKGYIQRAKAQRMQPGPGDYNHKNIVGKDGPGYTMGGSRADVRVLPGKHGRGPASYTPNHNPVKIKTASYCIGKDQKGTVPDVYGRTPGPDNYDPNYFVGKNKAASWGAGSGNRPPLSQILKTPGPGEYDPKLGKGKGAVMTGKEKHYIKPSPGPADYKPNTATVKNRAAKYS